jgi:predicted secreted protein
MQRNILQGSEFLLYNIDNEPVAYSTNCVLKINQNLSDVTTKDSQSWTDLMAGLKNWSIDFDGLVSYGDGFSTSFFLNKYQSSEPFFIKFGVVQEGFTHAFSGEVNIESIEQTADDGEIVTYSGTLKGVGNLSFQDEGEPVQNGYLKVEEDPIFRGSPAFNISETDKEKWNEANSKIVNELEFSNDGVLTTLKIKFKDGTSYSSSFKPIVGVVDLSGYYTKGQSDAKIQTAQVAADTANSMLTDIASDSKLSPAEKINVLKEWEIISDEKPKIVNQAAIFGVDTLEYDVAYIELDEYLEPLLDSMITTHTIAGYDFRAYFRNYYDQKILILKAIAEASKNYTDEEIEALTIGTRNYHLNGDRTITVFQTENQTLQNGNYPVNAEMAISFLAKSLDGANRLFLEFDNSDFKEFNISGDWIRYTAILHTTDNPILYARIGDTSSVLNIGRSSVSMGFPYGFPTAFGVKITSGVQLKNIMIVQGNKPSKDFAPAPEDFSALINKAKNDAATAAKTYSDLQIELNNIILNAEIDQKITVEEQRAIADAQAKLEAARNYADAMALNAIIQANTHADGRIDQFESKLIEASDNNIAAALAYTDAQRQLSELSIKSWADNEIDSVEAALIQNAQNNLAAAKAYSDQQDLYVKTLNDSYIDQKITVEEQKRIDAVQASLTAAKLYTETQRILSETITKAYSDNLITEEEARAIADATAKMNEAKADAQAKIDALKIGGRNLVRNSSNFINTNYWGAATILTEDGKKCLFREYFGTNETYITHQLAAPLKKNTDYTISFMGKSTGANQEVYFLGANNANAKNVFWSSDQGFTKIVRTINTGAGADIISLRFDVNKGETAAHKSAIWIYDVKLEEGNKNTDWTQAPEDFYEYVDKSIVDKANEIIANTTSAITVANTATLQAAKSDAESKVEIAQAAAVASANSYTSAQRLLSEEILQANFDGKITAEEQARLTQAANNLQAAKEDATAKANTAAQYGIAAQNLHNALIGNLKSLAYTDVVEVSKLGSTVVEGGYLKTSLLDANYIKTGILNADYINSLDITAKNISATSGSIGTWTIDSTGLKDTTGNAYILSSVPHQNGGKTEASLGLAVTSGVFPGAPQIGATYFASKFISTSARGNGFNVGVYAEASGSGLNNTAIAAKGDVALEANGSINLISGNLNLFAGTSITARDSSGVQYTARSGHIMLENKVNTYRVIVVQNGLIVGVNENLPYQQYRPI